MIEHPVFFFKILNPKSHLFFLDTIAVDHLHLLLDLILKVFKLLNLRFVLLADSRHYPTLN